MISNQSTNLPSSTPLPKTTHVSHHSSRISHSLFSLPFATHTYNLVRPETLDSDSYPLPTVQTNDKQASRNIFVACFCVRISIVDISIKPRFLNESLIEKLTPLALIYIELRSQILSVIKYVHTSKTGNSYMQHTYVPLPVRAYPNRLSPFYAIHMPQA